MYYLTHPYFLIPGISTLIVCTIFYFGLQNEYESHHPTETAFPRVEFVPDHDDTPLDEELGMYINSHNLEFSGYRTTTIEINGRHFHLDIAEDSQTRTQGLSYRPSLSPEQGMLFIFNKSGKHGIWMKDMNFPIDIVWLNRDKEIVYIERAVNPDTFPQVFTPSTDALYVIELPADSIK